MRNPQVFSSQERLNLRLSRQVVKWLYWRIVNRLGRTKMSFLMSMFLLEDNITSLSKLCNVTQVGKKKKQIILILSEARVYKEMTKASIQP